MSDSKVISDMIMWKDSHNEMWISLGVLGMYIVLEPDTSMEDISEYAYEIIEGERFPSEYYTIEDRVGHNHPLAIIIEETQLEGVITYN